MLSPVELKEGKRLVKAQNDESYRDTHENSMDVTEETKEIGKSSATQKASEMPMKDIEQEILGTMRRLSGYSKSLDVEKIFRSLETKISRDRFEIALMNLSEDMAILSNDEGKTFELS